MRPFETQVPGRGQALAGSRGCAYLLRLDERLLLEPREPELLALLLREPLALARSLCARLFWLLACAPLRPASLRLMPPLEEDDERDEDEELRDAIDLLLDRSGFGPRETRSACVSI